MKYYWSVPELCLTFRDPIDKAQQAPLSMRFSRQEYWSGLPFPSLGIVPTQGANSPLLHWKADSLPLSHLGRIGLARSSFRFSVCCYGKTQTNFLANPIQMRLCTFTWAYRLIKFSVLLNAFSNLYSPLESFRFPYKTTPAFAWHPFPSLLETMCLFIISINCVISRMIYK